jgi:cytochrome c
MGRVTALFCVLAVSAGAAFGAGKGKEGDPQKGKAVFEQCAVCHNANSTEKKMGPGLKGLYRRDKLVNGQKVSDQTVRNKVDSGGNGMPAYKEMLSDQEKSDVISYLKTL